jgi:hypothetical protein
MSDCPTLVIGDEPVFKNGEFVVYESVSNFEEIKVHFGNRLSGPHKHIALRGDLAFVYDVDQQKAIADLGRYTLHMRCARFGRRSRG